MPTSVLLAPVGAGKTERALARITAVTAENPFARVWVLLASERQVNQFRNRLIQTGTQGPVFFNVEFFTFPQLHDRILNAAGVPTRRLSEPARLRLLRVLARRATADGNLPAYGEIAHKAGFVRVIADFIYELKGAMVEPDDFGGGVAAAFGARNKDAEILRLYGMYQQRLYEHDVVDREGQGWLALDALETHSNVARDVALIVVDGYDQFSPLQARTVAQMAGRVGETLVTLTDVPERAQTVGRRFVGAKEALEDAFVAVGHQATLIEAEERTLDRHADLQRLAEDIFRVEAVAESSSGGVRFISAADPAAETASVLREIKALLLPGPRGETRVRPEDVMVVLRDYERYHVHIRAMGRAYGLPLALHLGTALGDMPPIRLLMDALSLHDAQQHLTPFPRRAVLDLLASPYVSAAGLDTEAVALLERVSRELDVIGGRETWLSALDRAKSEREAEEDADEVRVAAILTAEQHEALRAGLVRFFDALTPPPTAETEQYVAWVEGLIGWDETPDEGEAENEAEAVQRRGYLGIVGNLNPDDETNTPERIVSRDKGALTAFKGVLTGLLSAQVLLRTLENTSKRATWDEFMADLSVGVERATVEANPQRGGRVLVTTATDARGLPHQHLFIMGMSEGLFPQRLAEDPLYLDSERRRLAEVGVAVRTEVERADDDGLFYELISLARARLTLSRPTVKNGEPWVASHLWDAAAEVFTDAAALIEAGEADVFPQLATATTPADVAIAVAEGLDIAETPSHLPGAYNWLIANEKRVWRSVARGRETEIGRLRGDGEGRYIGIIQDELLRAKIEERLSIREHLWSASQMNDYGICPYRFFAGRVLKLEALEEPSTGLDARQLGSLYHSILERLYGEIAKAGLIIEPSVLPDVLDFLDAFAEITFAEAPRAIGFREDVMWKEQQTVILGRLRALVTYDFTEMNAVLADQFGETRARRPFATELPFGIGERGRLLPLGDGNNVKLTGIIDRVDSYGDDVIVIDYKSGSSQIPLEELEAGRNFQIMLYVQAMADILQSKGNTGRVLGGFFWHIRNRKTSGLLNLNDEAHQQIMRGAEGRVQAYIQHARAGDFAVAPSKLTHSGKCTDYCDFYRLCRIAVTNPQKEN